jgi:glyoxylase-like metal-dependent hydrolase (beta-lactamase superfamily II)
MTRTERIADDLILIDTHYAGTPRAIGSYLLLGQRPALIETGPASTVETLLEGIRAAGLDPRDLQALAVTHIHLDHAGATGELVRRFPHLEVYVHPVGAPHMVDPSRLISSARRLYGESLETLLGEPAPVPAEQVHALADGDRVLLGSRSLTAIDSPGHARHHLVYFDEAARDLFTGDAAGVALPGSRYVRPPTPPPELDIPTWQVTIDRIKALGAGRLLLTHFGPHQWVDGLLNQMQERMHARVELVRLALEDGMDEEAIVDRLRAVGAAESAATDGPDGAARLEIIMSTRLSALGLIRYVRTR